MTELTCISCGDTFQVKPYRAKKAKFCGKMCAGKDHAAKYLNTGHKPWAAANLDGHRHKSPTRFKEGHETWNKGLLGIHLSPETEFKKGCESNRKLPLGSVTIRKDKQGKPRAFIKTDEGWAMRARAVYRAKHGEIPEGLVIHHIDGNPLNDRPSNLKALSRADHIEAHRGDLAEARNA